jgi:hypothetical protein
MASARKKALEDFAKDVESGLPFALALLNSYPICPKSL